MARITAHPQETVLEPAALEVVLELLLDIPGQGHTPCHQVGLERRIVFLDKLVKEGMFRAMALVDRRANARTGFPASRQRQHVRILARWSCVSG
jgi:hypothetical protein